MDILTIPEYKLLMKAVKLKQIDNDYRNHLQAYLNFVVQAEKKAGKGKTRPVYNTFKKFYDYNKELKKVENKKEDSRFSGLKKFLKRGG